MDKIVDLKPKPFSIYRFPYFELFFFFVHSIRWFIFLKNSVSSRWIKNYETDNEIQCAAKLHKLPFLEKPITHKRKKVKSNSIVTENSLEIYWLWQEKRTD